MTTTSVTNGETQTGSVVSSGNSEFVYADGTVISTEVLLGGYLIDSNGGFTSTTTLAGGTEIVSSGGLAFSTTVLSGGVEDIDSGGQARGTVISTGGSEVVYSGGGSFGDTISSGGQVLLLSGATEANVTVDSGGHLYAVPGANYSDVTGNVTTTGVVYVSNGRVGYASSATSGVTLNNNAGQTGSQTEVLDVLNGGSAVSSFVAGEDMTVFSGGVAINTTVENTDQSYQLGTDYTIETISSGGLDISATILTEANQIIDAGGVTSQALVEYGSLQTVNSGGLAVNTKVYEGAEQAVSYGGVASGTQVDVGFLSASAGGQVISTTISGQYSSDSIAGSALDTTVLSGGQEGVAGGGITVSTIISSGGSESVSAFGSATGTIVRFGGNAGDDGFMSNTIISSGGTETVYGDGTAVGTIVSAGGSEFVSGAASGTVVLSGGLQEVFGSGVASSTVLSSGADQAVSGGGTASGTIAQDGSQEFVFAGGVASNITLSSGTQTIVFSGGALDSASVASGAMIYATPGADVSGVNAPVISTGVVYVSSGVIGYTSGIASGLVISGSFDQIDALPGGTANSATLIAGGSGLAYSGGVLENTAVSSGGEAIAESGGLLVSTNVTGGTVEVLAGGTATSGLIGGFGEEAVQGTASDLVVSNGTLQVAAGGSASDVVASGDSVVYADSGSTISDLTATGGGGFFAVSGSTVANVTLADSAVAYIETGVVASGGFMFSGTGNVVRVAANPASGGALLSGGAVVSGFASGDTFILAGVDYSSAGSATLGADNLLSVSENGETYTLQLAPNESYAGDQFMLSSNQGDTAVEVETSNPCFVTGTRVRVAPIDAELETCVEDLVVGDLVVVREDGRLVDRPVRWVGRRSVDVSSHPRPEFVRPVRILPGALAVGVPSRTLRVSPDHALLVDGHLIQARQLVNGASIAIEHGPAVTYYHVELDRHGILLAEGAAAESYLDTGNRHQFEGEAALALHPDFARAEHPEACAPLATDAATVHPIWERLAARSVELGHALSAAATTSEPMLRLVLTDGTVLLPQENGPRKTFTLGRRCDAARLLSRAASPAALAPWCDDRRRLGVKVATIRAWTFAGGVVSLPLDGLGWWNAEADGRWNNGDAAVSLPEGCVLVEVTLAATGEYPAEATALSA